MVARWAHNPKVTSSIINGNDLNVRPFLFFIESAEDVATDAAVTGNSNSNSHVYFP